LIFSTPGGLTGRDYKPIAAALGRHPKEIRSWCDSAIFKKSAKRQKRKAWLAERVGFEPTVEFPQHTLSKRAP
jgi:hypothetical protein